MSPDYHPTRDRLMDFVDGGLAGGQAREVGDHLAGCEACRAYVESLKHTLTLLEGDAVPEPSEAYFAFLAGRARQHARAGGTRLVFRFAPGLAAAAAAVLLMWWVAGTPTSPVDGVDIIMAEMTTGEIVETFSTDPYAGSLIIEASRTSLDEIDDYLRDTETIYDLLDSMSDDEKTRFTTYLKGLIGRDGKTSGLVTGSLRKEC
jgi:hypothetical protein